MVRQDVLDRVGDGDTPEHVVQTTGRVETALKGCKFSFWEDLSAESLKQWLHSQRTTRVDFGLATSNHYIKAMRAFAEWCRKRLKRTVEANPFESMELMKEAQDIRRKRRAATDNELQRLIVATETNTVLAGLSGEDRAMLYRVSATLALRLRMRQPEA
jgi:hypothetical protein